MEENYPEMDFLLLTNILTSLEVQRLENSITDAFMSKRLIDMTKENAYDVVHPICCTQKIKVYETRTRFYLVGSNTSQTRFRILKIDRTEPTEINVIDDKVEYNRREIRDLLHRIDVGNRPKSLKAYEKGSFGLTYRCTAYGILGFIRFLEGYYIILISKRRKVALIGGHAVYKIDDTEIIPIANEQARSKMNSNTDEVKYMRIFQNVDLSSNFYFSYSYDLTRTLQYNLAPYYGIPYKYCSSTKQDNDNTNKCSTPKKENEKSVNDNQEKGTKIENVLRSQDNELKEGDVELLSADMFPDSLPRYDGVPPSSKKYNVKVFRGKPSEKYVWNSYILKGIQDEVHPDWLLNIIHGFVGQSNICVYGKPLYITLIARRSNKFAGTRFLKRGANDEGFVANDVETEQICHDASVISLRSGRYTSYVQMRGSAPFFWSQDTIQGRITPKPQILVDRADPYFSTTATHFNQLLSRYGSPIIILNLVKIKEKKPHEQILSGLLKESVEYLNQFLPPQHAMLYKAWDMARVTKCKEQKVIEILAEIAEQVMKETGFFQSGPQLFCNELRKHPSFAGMKGHGYSDENLGLLQTGILRVNCVDCLDRTNATQFMVGKCALGFQLYALGVVESPILQFDSDALRMLEELFEAHGDTLALQYGGSQMVHRIRTYRKIAPWTSYSRDIMQTVSRYYSNAFTDTDKQQAINLFLGTFQPYGNNDHIWDIPTDYYLHHSSTINLDSHSVRPSYTKWWHDEVMNALPFSWEEKAKRELIENDEIRDDDDESMDLFSEYYRPAELTEFENLFCKNMPTSIKDFMPGSSGDPSPFVVRARGRSHGDASPTAHRHQIGGQPVPIDDSSDDDDESSDDERDVYSPFKASGREALVPGDPNENWPALTNLYGINVVEPGTNDKLQYQRYAEISQLSNPNNTSNSHYNVSWPCASTFSNDSTSQVKLPSVDVASQSLYSNYCKIGQVGPSAPNNFDLDIYQSYIRQNYL